jgi:hypothetical protein
MNLGWQNLQRKGQKCRNIFEDRTFFVFHVQFFTFYFNVFPLAGREDIRAATVPLLPDAEDIHEDAAKTPIFGRNRFFGIPLTDSAQASPRYRTARKVSVDRPEFLSELQVKEMATPFCFI